MILYSSWWWYSHISLAHIIILLINVAYPPNGAGRKMLCHGSHQYTPVMLAYIYIYQHHGSVMGTSFFNRHFFSWDPQFSSRDPVEKLVSENGIINRSSFHQQTVVFQKVSNLNHAFNVFLCIFSAFCVVSCVSRPFPAWFGVQGRSFLPLCSSSISNFCLSGNLITSLPFIEI